MSESADPMYEDLNAQIADLRKTIAEKDRKILSQVDEIISIGNELHNQKIEYSKIVQDLVKLSLDSNKTIQAVIGKKWDYYGE
jgi:hypothetical protein